jgi:hypothetical protein
MKKKLAIERVITGPGAGNNFFYWCSAVFSHPAKDISHIAATPHRRNPLTMLTLTL